MSTSSSSPIAQGNYNAYPDATVKHNIEFLKSHKGKRFDFDDQGKMYLMGLSQRVGYFISGLFSAKQFNRVKNKFNAFTRSLTVTDQTSDANKKAITELFFHTLPQLSLKFYKRDIDQTVFEHLEQALTPSPKPNAIDPLMTTLTDKEDAINWPTELPVAAPKSVASAAKVWVKMGSFIQSTSGSSISYRIIEGEKAGKKGRTLGIFKAASEEPLGSKNNKLIQRIKKFALKFMSAEKLGSLHETAAGQGFVAEVVSKKVADKILTIVGAYEEKLRKEGKLTTQNAIILQKIKSGLVPNTEIVTFELGQRSGEVGSFQEWVEEGHEEAYKFLGLKNKNYKGLSKAQADSTKSAIPDELIDLLVIMDYATGNSDRHGENWFVMTTQDEQQHTRVSGIRLIDGGWAMAPKHAYSEQAIELGNQYKWRHLPFADKPFTKLGKYVIQQLYKQRKSLGAELSTLYNENLPDANDIDNLTPQRIHAMDERLEVMHRMKTQTKKDLAEIRTQDQVAAVLDMIPKKKNH